MYDMKTIIDDLNSMTSHPLKIETYHYQQARERLLFAWPQLDPETLADTLEGITRPARDDSGGDPLGASG